MIALKCPAYCKLLNIDVDLKPSSGHFTIHERRSWPRSSIVPGRRYPSPSVLWMKIFHVLHLSSSMSRLLIPSLNPSMAGTNAFKNTRGLIDNKGMTFKISSSMSRRSALNLYVASKKSSALQDPRCSKGTGAIPPSAGIAV